MEKVKVAVVGCGMISPVYLRNMKELFSILDVVAVSNRTRAKAEEAAKKKAAEEKAEEEPVDHTIYYVTDPQQQSQYIRMFRNNKMQAFILDHTIDQPFIQQLEAKNEGLHFARIDATTGSVLRSRISEIRRPLPC